MTTVYLILDANGEPAEETDQGNGIAFTSESEAEAFALEYNLYVFAVDLR